MAVDFAYAWEILPDLLRATVITIEIAGAGFVLSLGVGVFLAVLRTLGSRPVRLLAYGYVEFVRLTPLLVQLFFAFYVLPLFGVTIPAITTGILVLGLNYGAYTSEVFRTGIEAVPAGQWEAATALDLDRKTTWLRIVLPQAIKPMIPSLGNYLISMFKEVPLLATITVYELLNTANLLASQSFNYIIPLTMVGLIFFLLSYPASILVRRLERRYAGR